MENVITKSWVSNFKTILDIILFTLAAIEQARFKYPQICKHFSGEDWDNSLQRYLYSTKLTLLPVMSKSPTPQLSRD